MWMDVLLLLVAVLPLVAGQEPRSSEIEAQKTIRK
jgi:hypothetical protein